MNAALLLIEDDLDTRATLTWMMESWGLEVQAAADCAHGRAMARAALARWT